MVGITLHQIAFWHSMIGTHQNLWAQLGGFIGLLNRGRQRVDIIWTIKIWANSPCGRLPSLFDQASEKLIIGCGGGGPGELRIEWKEQNFLAAGIHHLLHNGLGGRVAVAHTILNHNTAVIAFRDFCAHSFGLCFCNGGQRAFIGFHVPNRLIGRAGRKWSFC